MRVVWRMAAVAAAVWAPGVVTATELCRTPNKTFVVRDHCKRRDEIVTPSRKAELGLAGPPGPSGPPGPASHDLRVVDANGADVGVVTDLPDYYGTASAIVVRELPLPGLGQTSFVRFPVVASGIDSFEGNPDCPLALYYRTDDCSGEPLAPCGDFQACSSATGAFFATDLFRAGDGKVCYAVGGPEFERGDFYAVARTKGFFPTPEAAIADCVQRLRGKPVGPPEMRRNFYFIRCCVLRRNAGAAPVHTIGASVLGSPPFRLDQ